MRVPSSTYRLQFNQSFRFVDGRDLVPYLNDLGITDLYSSPWFKARRGSTHGYDIANPFRVNSELGTEDDFFEMAEKLQHYDMGLVLDIVPNHMSATPENPWWMDVLENGSSSPFARYFDIDWHPAASKAAFLQENRVLLPVLGDLYGNVLERGELVLKIDDTGLFARYFESKLPLDPKTYPMVLERITGLREIDALLAAPLEPAELKRRLWAAYHGNAEVRQAVEDALRQISASPDDFDRLLSRQAWRIAYWKIGYEEINYRRFFDINDLVGLRVEDPEVFEMRHRRIVELAGRGQVNSLRIDHIDGLLDPAGYLENLQRALGRETYVVAEKILGRDEPLIRQWALHGTTGYDFLNALNGIFIDPEGRRRMEEAYDRATGNTLPFAEICYAANKLVMERLFMGEINSLGHALGELAAADRQARDVRLTELMAVLVEVTACLPVYRTYIRDFNISLHDRGYIERTLALARSRTPEHRVSQAAFDFIRRVLLLDPPAYAQDQKQAWLEFVMRWQQFSGPAMAKGLEDTASYEYSALLSINEVGGDPLREKPPVDLAGFHEFNRARRRCWPHTFNATSTHDTKRSEDVRARLNVLTEIPDEWDSALARWSQWNRDAKRDLHGQLAPDPGEEILIYQTLLGTFPPGPAEEPAWLDRVKEFLTKALREAKRHSSWMEPHSNYEEALHTFTESILAPGRAFRSDFLAFQERISWYGALNGLSQVLLKIASPGVPDFYQGCELWNFTMVDPDNRRPVDYRKRIAMLESLKAREAQDRRALVRSLAADPRQDEAKLYCTYKALEFRRARSELFAQGDYTPLAVTGPKANHLCAFARGGGVVALTPRWQARLGSWEDTTCELPEGEWVNVFTAAPAPSHRVADLLRDFPVALLEKV